MFLSAGRSHRASVLYTSVRLLMHFLPENLESDHTNPHENMLQQCNKFYPSVASMDRAILVI